MAQYFQNVNSVLAMLMVQFHLLGVFSLEKDHDVQYFTTDKLEVFFLWNTSKVFIGIAY